MTFYLKEILNTLHSVVRRMVLGTKFAKTKCFLEVSEIKVFLPIVPSTSNLKFSTFSLFFRLVNRLRISSQALDKNWEYFLDLVHSPALLSLRQYRTLQCRLFSVILNSELLKSRLFC